MKLTRVIAFFITALLVFPAWSSAIGASSSDDLFRMSLEELMHVNVVTAGRQSQAISEAPAAMSVVTAEDIKQLGATQLSEALRMVVGVHLGRTNSFFSLAGGIRGFHKLPANKFVFLINGTPTSYEVYGLPELYQLPITLEEIEKIEILRGPGSSLYGANAMFGVINVITKKPADTQGTLFSVKAGEHDTYVGSLIHGGTVKNNLEYRIALGWDQRDNEDYIAWAHDPEQRYVKANTSIDYHIDADSTLSVFAGYLYPQETDILLESTGPIDFSGAETINTVLTYSSLAPNIKIKAHLKEMGWNEGHSLGQQNLQFKMGTKGVEFQHKFSPFAGDTLIWGGNFDQKYAQGPSIGGKHTHEIPGIFVDNTYEFTEALRLNGGLRLDSHSITGETVSHRVSLMFSPCAGHHLRATWGSSYRNPDFIESYYSRVSPFQPGTFIRVFGNKDNDPEKATTYELAYMGQLWEKLGVNVNLFYSTLDDFIYFIQEGEPYVDEAAGGTVIPFPFINIGDARQFGAELEFRYQITQWLHATANYTYIDQEEKDDTVKQLLVMTPQHIANGQLRAKFSSGFSANATVHYKDVTRWREYTWPSPDGNTVAGGKADSHVFANLRVGYAFSLAGKQAELGISAFNVFNTTFDEYPLSTSDVSRRVAASFEIQL